MSYARVDAEFALRLARELRTRGVNIWMDQLNLSAGERWDQAVERALSDASTVLVLLSPDAIASANVMDEASFALEEGKPTVPVICRPCKLPLRLRRLHFVDFTTSTFEDGLRQLVPGLAPATPTEPQSPSPSSPPATIRKQEIDPVGASAGDPHVEPTTDLEPTTDVDGRVSATNREDRTELPTLRTKWKWRSALIGAILVVASFLAWTPRGCQPAPRVRVVENVTADVRSLAGGAKRIRDLDRQLGGPPVAAYSSMSADVDTRRQEGVVLVTSDFFTTLREVPYLGRTFIREETDHVAVLAYQFWVDSFDSDPAVVGRTIRINGSVYFVVGVAQKNFAVPEGVHLWVNVINADVVPRPIVIAASEQ